MKTKVALAAALVVLVAVSPSEPAFAVTDPTAPARALPAVAGKTYHLVGGWEDLAMESYSFSADGSSFFYSRETGDESSSAEAKFRFESDAIGLRMKIAPSPAGAGRPPFEGERDIYVNFLGTGTSEVLVAYTTTRVLGVYAIDPQLAVAEADWSASSEFVEVLKGKTIRYGAVNLGDRSLETFWAEAAKGPGRGEWLEAAIGHWNGDPVTTIRPAFAIVFAGVPMRPDLDAKNASPKTVTAGMPGGKLETTNLADSFLPQIVALAPVKGVGRVRFTFTDVYRGTAYEDMCVGEIVILGRP